MFILIIFYQFPAFFFLAQYNLLSTIYLSYIVNTVNRSLILPYSCAEMYSLVDKIDRYQEFLPWCYDSVVLERKPLEVTARVDVSFNGIKMSFTTRNTSISDTEMKMELVDGPFDDWAGSWKFTELDESVCRVALELKFSLVGKLKNRTLGPVLTHISNTLVDAFAERAKELYGERKLV